MKITALLIIASILASGYTTSIKEQVQKIEKSQFGNALMVTIQAQLATNTPIDKLSEMLTEMDTDIFNQQSEADAYHKAFQDNCDTTQNNYNQAIADNEFMISTHSANLIEYHAELDDTNNQIFNQEGYLQAYHDSLQQLILQRQAESDEFETQMNEHSIAEAAVLDAKSYFAQMSTASTSFLQKNINAAFVQMSNRVTQVKKELKSKHYKALFTLLATIANKAPIQADQKIISTILGLCDKIVANIRNSRSMLSDQEATRVENYHTQKDLLEDAIRSTGAILVNLTAQKGSLEQSIANSERIVSEQTEYLADNQQALAETIESCNADMAFYNEKTAQRDSDRSIIAEVLNIIETKLSNLQQYVMDVVEARAS